MDLKQQILAIPDASATPPHPIALPEWDGMTVYIRVMSGEERDAWESTLLDEQTKKISHRNIRAKLVAACLVDEQGARLFSDAEVDILGRKSGAVLQRLWNLARKVNALDEKDLEELEKNSAGGPAAAS